MINSIAEGLAGSNQITKTHSAFLKKCMSLDVYWYCLYGYVQKPYNWSVDSVDRVSLYMTEKVTIEEFLNQCTEHVDIIGNRNI